MRVLLIIEGTYPWYRGGVSEWVYQYLVHLPDVHFTVLQLATDEFMDLEPHQALYPIPDNVETFRRISPPEMKGNWQEYLERWYQQNLFQLKGLLAPQDVIHVTNTGFAGWLGTRLSGQFNRPLLLTEHAIYWKEVEMGAVALECGYKIPENGQSKQRITQAFKEIAKNTYSHASQIVTVSQSNIPYQEGTGAQNISYIPNGIPDNWLQESKIRSKNPVIGWVGRCAEMKNPLVFFEWVEAFRKIDFSPRFRMLLSDANEKNLQAKVEQKAKEYDEVELVWNQPAKQYFGDFDFLAITSHNESQPLVMLEALAHRALPTGHSVGDLTDEYGLVFDQSLSYKEMAGIIADLWNQPEVFEQYVSKRFKQVKKEHTWNQIFEQYHELLHRLTT